MIHVERVAEERRSVEDDVATALGGDFADTNDGLRKVVLDGESSRVAAGRDKGRVRPDDRYAVAGALEANQHRREMIGVAPDDKIAAHTVAWNNRLEKISVELILRDVDVHVTGFVPDGE